MNFLTIFGLDLLYRAEYNVFTILDCCDFIGLRLTRLCFHKKLMIGGNCRFCLCSVIGERKYVIGCFYKVRSGITIRHISLFFNQFKFLLFLILNHPTDCPVCDQVGICEIQNIFNVFGTALRIRGFVVHSFYSINCGFFLQFVMSRCIHCLRCVRFMREILCINSWGFYGRGQHLQVGLYIRSFLNLQVVDSLIKICPVGALTSKLFIFEVRNWEISQVYFLNVYNCLVDYIMVNVCNSIIYKVVSITQNSCLSNEWLLDNVKNLIHNTMYQRICVPFSNIKINFNFKILQVLSWNAIYFMLCNLFMFIKEHGFLRFVSVFINSNLDICSFFYIKKTFLLFNIYNFNTNYFTDLTAFFKLNHSQFIHKSDFWFLIGLEFETKFTAFGLKLKDLWNKSNLLIFCLGFYEVWNIPVYFLGSVTSVYWSILCGTSTIVNLLLLLKLGVILINSFLLNLYSSFFSIFLFFDMLYFFKSKFVWGVLSIFSNFVGKCFINFTFKNNVTCLKSIFSKYLYFFFDSSFVKININLLVNSNIFSCYVGTYFNKLVSFCNVVLPLYTLVEKSKILYMDIFGKLRSANRIIKVLLYTSSDFFVCLLFRNLFFFLLNDCNFGRWCLNLQFNFVNAGLSFIYNNNVWCLPELFLIYFVINSLNVCGNFLITDFMNGLVLQEILQDLLIS